MTTETAAPVTLDDMLGIITLMQATLDAEAVDAVPRENLVEALRQSCTALPLALQAAAVVNHHLNKVNLELALLKVELETLRTGNRKARRKAAAEARH